MTYRDTAFSAASSQPTNYHSFQDALDDETGLSTNQSRDGTYTSRTTKGESAPYGLLSPLALPSSNEFRGFSTSIHDMFQETSDERIDCCALTCCGILQSDRDRYLMQGISPPGLCRRILLHVVFPFFLFLIAGFAAVYIRDHTTNEMVCVGLLLLMASYGLLQCYKGHAKRVDIRKDILWTKYQLQDHRRSSRVDLWRLLEQMTMQR
jgi:hypothetical protein